MYYANQGGHEGGQAPHPIFETPKTSVSLTNALSKFVLVVFNSAWGTSALSAPHLTVSLFLCSSGFNACVDVTQCRKLVWGQADEGSQMVFIYLSSPVIFDDLLPPNCKLLTYGTKEFLDHVVDFKEFQLDLSSLCSLQRNSRKTRHITNLLPKIGSLMDPRGS